MNTKPQSAHRRWTTRLLAALVLIVMGLLASAQAFAVPPGGDPPPDPGDPPPYTAPANGFDWAMNDRFGPSYNGLVDFHWNQAAPAALRWGTEADREKYDPSYVLPSGYDTGFNGCPTGDEYDASTERVPTANTYTWTVNGQTVNGQTLISTRTCLFSYRFPLQTSYTVGLVISGPNAGSFSQTVTIRDYLVVSIGDSYASGEGNPDVPINGSTPARWEDKRCHRSSLAGPAQAAMSLERSDPHTSITFLSFACSGATINQPYFGCADAAPLSAEWYDSYRACDPNKPKGTGILGQYQGAEPNDPNNYNDQVPSQITQVRNAVGNRRIDALLVSGGGNDIGFGPLGDACVKSPNCLTQNVSSATGTQVPLPTRFESDRQAMSARYAALQQAILTLDVGRTFITEYPDPTTDVNNSSGGMQLCDEILEDIAWFLTSKMDTSETAWAHNTVLPGLDNAVRAAAQQNGWTYVDGMVQGFQGHGYCVGNSDQPNSDRWIRTAAEAAVLQGPDRIHTSGTLHPTARGHQVYRDRILAYVKPYLATLPLPAPIGRADTYQTSEDAPLSVAAPGVLANDAERTGGSLTASLYTGPAHGTLALNPNGSFVYTPAHDYYGADSFSYLAGSTSGTSAPTTVSINVMPWDDAPVAVADSYTTAAGTTLTVTAPGVLGNDSDVDSTNLSTYLASFPTHGTLNFYLDGSFIYTPAAGFTGTDAFSYDVYDGSFYSAVAAVTLTVTPATTPPPTSTTLYAASITKSSGTVQGGGVASLKTDDNVFYKVGSTTTGTRTVAWYGTVNAVPNAAKSLKVFYRGKSTLACTQTVELYNFTTGKWVVLKSGSVGTAEISWGNLAAKGSLADYVSGTSGNGSVRIRVRATAAKNFSLSTDLLSLAYT